MTATLYIYYAGNSCHEHTGTVGVPDCRCVPLEDTGTRGQSLLDWVITHFSMWISSCVHDTLS